MDLQLESTGKTLTRCGYRITRVHDFCRDWHGIRIKTGDGWYCVMPRSEWVKLVRLSDHDFRAHMLRLMVQTIVNEIAPGTEVHPANQPADPTPGATP